MRIALPSVDAVGKARWLSFAIGHFCCLCANAACFFAEMPPCPSSFLVCTPSAACVLPEQAHSCAFRKLVKDQVALDELPKDLRNVADKFSRGEISSKDVSCTLRS